MSALVAASIILGVIIFIVVLVIGLEYTVSIFSLEVWNKIHNTNFTAWDWMVESDTIKDYQAKGKIQTIHLRRGENEK